MFGSDLFVNWLVISLERLWRIWFENRTVLAVEYFKFQSEDRGLEPWLCTNGFVKKKLVGLIKHNY